MASTGHPRRRWLRWGAWVLLAGLGLMVLGLLLAGEWFSRPAARAVGAPPEDLGARVLRLPVPESGGTVVGWWSPGPAGGGSVLLLHGVRGDRTQMAARAAFLRRAGYAVLLIDLPAHGQSTGARIAFGAREAEGVRAALDFLRRERPGERVGVIGVSLGAASLLLARPDPAPDAVVLESVYPTIEEAVRDRLRLHAGSWAGHLAPLLLWQLPWRTGVRVQALRPIDALAQLRCPVLIAAGTRDRHTPWSETERLYRAASEPKALWPVQDAAHVDLHGFAPAAYEARILGFLARHLRGERAPGG